MLCVLRRTLMDDHVRDLAGGGRDKPDVFSLIRSSRLPATVRGHEGPGVRPSMHWTARLIDLKGD